MSSVLESSSFGKKALLGISIILVTVIVELLVLLMSIATEDNGTPLWFEIMGLFDAIKFIITILAIILVIQIVGLKFIYDDVRYFSEYLTNIDRYSVVNSNSDNLPPMPDMTATIPSNNDPFK